MDTNEALTQVLANIRQKYNHLNSIMNATKDLMMLADKGDLESFGIMLNMREGSMRQIDELNEQNDALVARIPEPLQARVQEMLRPTSGAPVTLDNPLQTALYDASKRNSEMLKRIIDADAELTQKVKQLQGK